MTPFTADPNDQVATIREVALIKHITKWMELISPPPPFGIGDDCAVMDSGDVGTILTTVDALVWNEHFDDTFTAQEAGAKLLKRNLSDIAAMGGGPAGAVIALTLSDDVSVQWLEAFYEGLRDHALTLGMLIVGGDVTRGGKSGFFAAHLTLMGSAIRAVRRNGGQVAGDFIMVTGELGGSRHGKEKTFSPRLKEGEWLAEQSVVKAMIDVTDGLAKDLPALLPEGVCARLEMGKIPVSQAAHEWAKKTGRTAMEHALADGEDYELLLIVDQSIDPQLMLDEWARTQETPITLIGQLADATESGHDQGLVDQATGKLITTEAFQHFNHPPE